jgi:hypothetical protein
VTVLYLINTMIMLNCDCVVLDQHYDHAELWLCCTWSTLWTLNWIRIVLCTSLLSFCLFSFGHCIVYLVIYGFWLLLWYLRFTDSDYFFGILDLRILIISLVSSNFSISFSLEEEFEDTKWVVRIRKSKKNRQHNGQKKKYKRTNNDLQNIHIKLKIE